MKAPWLLVVGVLAGCSTSFYGALPICNQDSDCADGQLCFAEGCGDPGRGIVVEIEGGAINGQAARDIALPDGTVGATQHFDLGRPLSISGEFQRERSAASNPTDRTFYSDPVIVRAVGQSELLPGINRTFEARFDSTERGAFEMRLGAGAFKVTAVPGDRTVPPISSAIVVSPDGGTEAVTFVFPAADSAPALTGQLIKKMDFSVLPPEPVLLSGAYTITGGSTPTVDLQLFDVESNPLSQRFPIASTTGEFAITVSPEARNKSRLILVAAPRDPGVPIPTKRFVLEGQLTSAVALEYGDFGDAADVTGTILDAAGAPVVGAQVVLEGTVVGDGVFRSKIVETNAEGVFKVTSLGSQGEGTFRLSVVPPRGSRAAATQHAVTVRVTRPLMAPGPVGTLSPAVLTLEDRLVARGKVLRPGDGKDAQGVFVRATLQPEKLGSTDEFKSLPIEPAETVTGPDGTFEMPLDPGVWRFEYIPGELLPLSSRLVTIKPTIEETTGRKLPTVELTEVPLSFGRTVSGVVTASMGTQTGQPVPYSQLRFFRVTTVEGRPASILLGSTIADDRGRYQVVLPSGATPVSK